MSQARWLWGTIGAVAALVFLSWLLGQDGLAGVLRAFAWPVAIIWLARTFREPIAELIRALKTAELGSAKVTTWPKQELSDMVPEVERMRGPVDQADDGLALESTDGHS